jgi:uncharacterized protein YdcH (DUF465 family)
MLSRLTVPANAPSSTVLYTAMGDPVLHEEERPMIVAMADDRLTELETRHRQLHNEVHELERRVFLTPDEQRLVVELKKQKLVAKDELYAARRAAQQ